MTSCFAEGSGGTGGLVSPAPPPGSGGNATPPPAGAAGFSAAGLAGTRTRMATPHFGHFTAPLAWADSGTFKGALQEGQLTTRSIIGTPSRVNSQVFSIPILPRCYLNRWWLRCQYCTSLA